MKLKLDENGNVVVQDGKPVYVHDDGKELPFDAPQAMQAIAARNAEAKKHREAAEEYKSKLSAFDGIDDPQAAIKALQTVSNLDDKKLIDAGEAEKVKAEAIKVYEGKLAEKDGELARIQSQFHGEVIGGAFARSQFIAEKMAIPADLVQAYFGKNLSINADGQLVAKDANGNDIYSSVNPGQLAGFDEALEMLVAAYPNKDLILKGSGNQGGNTNNGAPGVIVTDNPWDPKKENMTKQAELFKADPAKARAMAKEHGIII